MSLNRKCAEKYKYTHNTYMQTHTHTRSPAADSAAADEEVMMVGVGEAEATPGEFVRDEVPREGEEDRTCMKREVQRYDRH